MRNSVKYIVLVVASIAAFLILFVSAMLLIGWKSLMFPETLIMPMLGCAILVAGLVLASIWGFKFSAGKKHAKFLVIAISLIVAALVVLLLGKVVNSAITRVSVMPPFYL